MVSEISVPAFLYIWPGASVDFRDRYRQSAPNRWWRREAYYSGAIFAMLLLFLGALLDCLERVFSPEFLGVLEASMWTVLSHSAITDKCQLLQDAAPITLPPTPLPPVCQTSFEVQIDFGTIIFSESLWKESTRAATSETTVTGYRRKSSSASYQ